MGQNASCNIPVARKSLFIKSVYNSASEAYTLAHKIFMVNKCLFLK